MDSAVRYDQRGDRERADALFRQLLRQAARNTGYTEHMVALLPRAADFYSKGDEIPADQIENLYLDALDAIKRFRGEDHYDYEAVYGGLEKHYFSLGRYAESAVQTRQLLQFYRLKYVDNADSYYAVIQPTTMRLGRNLLAAGRNAEAREAYGAALEMAAEHHRPVAHIEELIKKTYEEAEEIEE
ncbi:MAG: hypothetical protein QF609_07680 [Gammaproteobacteria bacterium]|nr:hypothetical protein [Gammaproteobacteria bacterium]